MTIAPQAWATIASEISRLALPATLMSATEQKYESWDEQLAARYAERAAYDTNAKADQQAREGSNKHRLGSEQSVSERDKRSTTTGVGA